MHPLTYLNVAGWLTIFTYSSPSWKWLSGVRKYIHVAFGGSSSLISTRSSAPGFHRGSVPISHHFPPSTTTSFIPRLHYAVTFACWIALFVQTFIFIHHIWAKPMTKFRFPYMNSPKITANVPWYCRKWTALQPLPPKKICTYFTVIFLFPEEFRGYP